MGLQKENRAAVADGGATAHAPALPATADVINYVTRLHVSGLGATAATVIEITLTGVLGGTRRWRYSVPAGVAAAAPDFLVEFETPLRASNRNTACTLNVPSFGAGNTAAHASIDGFAIYGFGGDQVL